MPGTTTYLDTPVVSVAAFTGPDQFPLDCEFPTGTPVISNVVGHLPTDVSVNGPYVAPSPTVPNKLSGQLTLTSAGTVAVKNPAYDGTLATPQTITRDYGFGDTKGSVKIGNTVLTGTSITTWNATTIIVQVPYGTQSGELTITRAETADASGAVIPGNTTPVGLTVTVAPTNLLPSHVNHSSRGRVVPAGGSIQTVIDTRPGK